MTSSPYIPPASTPYKKLWIFYLFTIILLWAAVVTFLCGCARSAISDKLHIAERIMTSHPDSALTLLRSLVPADIKDIKGNEDQALYALLYTQALDKNYLVPTNDSLISVATDYYRSADDTPHLMLAEFYSGRVHANNNRPAQALVSFYKAKDLAEKADSNFWAAMACRGISDTYMQTYNRTEELAFAQKEYDHFKRSGRQPHLNFALLDLGRAYGNNEQWEKTLTITDQLIDSAQLHADPYLHYAALQLKSWVFLKEKNYSDAYPILLDICDGEFAQTIDSLNLCQAMVHKDMCTSAIPILDNISDTHPGAKNMIWYVIYKKTGQYDKALLESERTDSIAGRILRTTMSQNIAGTLSDYFEMEKKINEAEIKAARLQKWIIILLGTMLVSGCVAVGAWLYLRRKRDIEEKVNLAEQLRLSRADNTKSADIIAYLWKSKFELLEQLCNILISNNGDEEVSKPKIANAVTKLIKELSDAGDRINALEKKTNSLCDNVCSDFRNDLPNLKEEDYRLFLFSIHGLSLATITLLLGETKIQSIYNRKKRLKVKINSLSSDKRDRYLAWLDKSQKTKHLPD